MGKDIEFPEWRGYDDLEKMKQLISLGYGIEYDGEYHGRFFYQGPAVRTNEKGFPTRQDVIRATKVKLQWDELGLDFIIYPAK